MLYGAIIGDMVGAPYEFDRSEKIKDFPLWKKSSRFTDDSVMTLAIADAILDAGKDIKEDKFKQYIIHYMRYYGKLYPDMSYGCRFSWWLTMQNPKPLDSYGNGSAMRVSSIGWLYDTIERTREVARWSAEVSHNHPEGVKGAESVASSIFLARNNFDKDYIKKYIEDEFGYDLSKTCDEIRPTYHHVESCQETVPQAITAFLEGKDFEDVIRTAVSLGGDCDTLTCIAGSMAEAMYPIPADILSECKSRLTSTLLTVVDKFNKVFKLE